MSIEAFGFAVIDDEHGIDVRTVSPHERAAKVNWLCVAAHVEVTRAWTDRDINQAFEAYAENVRVARVRITATEN